MSVAPEITRAILEEELEAMAPLGSLHDWKVALNLEALTVTVRMTSSVDGEEYILEAQCDNYKEWPPHFEFIHPHTEERGSRHCYPHGGSFFHDHPCICVQWNRKTYIDGPHRDWQLATWQNERPHMTYLGDMFSLVQMEINKKGQYQGRKR